MAVFALLLVLACKPPTGGVDGRLPKNSPAWSFVAHHHDGTPAVVAHRGASVDAPENTLAAYREAIQQGAKIAETDVHLSADGRVVVIHDANTLRTTGSDALVIDSPWASLRELDAGGWFSPAFSGERLPELGELLDLTRGKMVLIVEIKAGARVVEPVRALIDARGMRPEVIIFSFDPAAVAESRRVMPDVPAVFLLTPSGERYAEVDVATAAATGANAVGFSHRHLDKPIFDAAHSAGLPVFVWTIDDPARAMEIRDWGADAIITNRPAVIAAALEKAGA